MPLAVTPVEPVGDLGDSVALGKQRPGPEDRGGVGRDHDLNGFVELAVVLTGVLPEQLVLARRFQPCAEPSAPHELTALLVLDLDVVVGSGRPWSTNRSSRASLLATV